MHRDYSEFVLLLPEMFSQDAADFGDRIRMSMHPAVSGRHRDFRICVVPVSTRKADHTI